MPTNPTATAADIHELGKSLADFRVEVAQAFGRVETDLAGFRSGIERELRLIRWAGTFFASVPVLLVGITIAIAHQVGRTVAAVESLRESTGELKSLAREHGGRLEKVERRLDGIDAKLDTLIRRTEPKTGGNTP
jgi:hypothetical protein